MFISCFFFCFYHLIIKAQVQKRVAISHECVLDKIANVRGAVMMAYPMGLPEWDIVKQSLDSEDGLKVKYLL